MYIRIFSDENEVVFVNFYADWCRFSQQLKPIYAQASENFKVGLVFFHEISLFLGLSSRKDCLGFG